MIKIKRGQKLIAKRTGAGLIKGQKYIYSSHVIAERGEIMIFHSGNKYSSWNLKYWFVLKLPRIIKTLKYEKKKRREGYKNR